MVKEVIRDAFYAIPARNSISKTMYKVSVFNDLIGWLMLSLT